MNDSNPSPHNKSEHAVSLNYKTIGLLQVFCFIESLSSQLKDVVHYIALTICQCRNGHHIVGPEEEKRGRRMLIEDLF